MAEKEKKEHDKLNSKSCPHPYLALIHPLNCTLLMPLLFPSVSITAKEQYSIPGEWASTLLSLLFRVVILIPAFCLLHHIALYTFIL